MGDQSIHLGLVLQGSDLAAAQKGARPADLMIVMNSDGGGESQSFGARINRNPEGMKCLFRRVFGRGQGQIMLESWDGPGAETGPRPELVHLKHDRPCLHVLDTWVPYT